MEGYAWRLQVQERMTFRVAGAIMDTLDPRSAIVVVEAEHVCTTARGISRPGALTATSAVRSLFEDDEKTRAEGLLLLR